MTNLYTSNAQEARKETYRLLGIRLDVPTEEIIAQWNAKRAADGESAVENAPVSLAVEWEPLSYKVEGGLHGNKEFDRIRLTKASGVSLDALTAIRAGGYPAIPSSAMYKTPGNPAKANPTKQAFPVQRFFVMAAKLGIDLSIDSDGSATGTPGQLYSKDAGQIFECSSGYEEFPTWGEDAKGNVKPDWEDTRQEYMRLPLARVKDYVQPENVPVRHIEAREDATATGGAATTAVGGGADKSAMLKAAVEKIGIAGKTVAEVNASAISLVAKNLGTNPILGTTDVANAARNGAFVDYLVNSGAVTVENDVLVAA